nr:immunoglobulin light chain junction region [Macaca mulatta]
CLQYKSFPNTF